MESHFIIRRAPPVEKQVTKLQNEIVRNLQFNLKQIKIFEIRKVKKRKH